MLDLALHYGEGPVSVKDIAEGQEVSERYLVHLMVSLKAAGLVRSMRGARGGFILAKAPSQIRLSEIVQIVEGSITPVECVDNPKACSRSERCVTRDIRTEMNKAMGKVLEPTTLEDLAQRQREKEKREPAM